MKKIIALLLTFVISTSFFVSCGDGSLDTDASKTTDPNNDAAPVTDLWDGSLASGFASGNGTEKDPYKIQTAEELAFLAKSVNEGTSYSGKYLILTNDIDLNNLEWTPIGNGKYAFEGNFDGNGRTVDKLNVCNALSCDVELDEDYTIIRGVAGLFGFCKNVIICDLNISNAFISIDNLAEYDSLSVGTLVARAESNSYVKISGIKISSSSLAVSNSKTVTVNPGEPSMYLGGVIGDVVNNASAEFNVSKVQSENVSIMYGRNYREGNCIGGIIGDIYNRSNFECSDFASYFTTEAPPYPEKCFYFGAFGYIYNRGDVKLSNGFSKLSIDKKEPFGYVAQGEHKWNVIVGCARHLTDTASYNFENLFGFIEAKNDVGVEYAYGLYFLSESGKFNEDNCIGCINLPEDHGLDRDVWDLDDLSAPKLK